MVKGKTVLYCAVTCRTIRLCALLCKVAMWRMKVAPFSPATQWGVRKQEGEQVGPASSAGITCSKGGSTARQSSVPAWLHQASDERGNDNNSGQTRGETADSTAAARHITSLGGTAAEMGPLWPKTRAQRGRRCPRPSRLLLWPPPTLGHGRTAGDSRPVRLIVRRSCRERQAGGKERWKCGPGPTEAVPPTGVLRERGGASQSETGGGKGHTEYHREGRTESETWPAA